MGPQRLTTSEVQAATPNLPGGAAPARLLEEKDRNQVFGHGLDSPIFQFAHAARRCETLRVAVPEIVGRWRLVSWSAQIEGGAVAYPFGEHAEGSLVYTPGGWMIGMLAAGDRANLSTQDVVGGSEEERALAFSSYVAYCGTYEMTATSSSTGSR